VVTDRPSLTEYLESVSHEDFNYRYCSEALIKGEDLDDEKIRKEIAGFGDSMVIAGSGKMIRIHIHTSRPQDLFEQLSSYGTLSYQKAEDMQRQKEIAENPRWKIALVTDSTSDVPLELLEQYQINVVPLNIHFGENTYLDKLTIHPERFYELIEKGPVFPSTSQPNEQSFYHVYAQLARHYDSIISVHISSKFSGTIQSATKAAERIMNESGKKVSILDSRHVSGSLGLLTLRVAKAIEEGMDHDSIAENFSKWRDNSRIYVSVRNLKNMVRGGRVSPAKGILARLMNVKPIVSMDPEGNSALFDRAYSQKANMKKVMKHARSFLNGRKIWNYQVLHAESDDAANWYLEALRELTGKEPVGIMNISSAIGLSAGKGTAAIAIMTEE
jgi:DegV family protein with EDD domain